ncbi:MAG: amidohydrolase family protein [Planctomycetes bacterium]|nr:amidohydrolase family protein [Planctomycetota bacterium]MBI3845718.1 amidohydrolase family protein [Planctomycetota bacterium]
MRRLRHRAARSLGAAFAAVALGPLVAAAASPRRLAIVGVTLVDGTGRPPRHDVTLLVEDDRIARVGPRSEIAVPADARRIDGAGRFVVPGLFDMHVHLHNSNFYPLFLANGVTSVRDLGNYERTILFYRDEAERSRVPAPRLFIAGPILDGPTPAWAGSLAIETPEQAHREVARLANEGMNVIKVYNGLSRDVLRAVIDEAHAHHLPVTGHVPAGMDAREAILMGMDGIEHMTGVALYGVRREAMSDAELSAVDNRTVACWWQAADPKKLQELAWLSASRGTFHCPTLFLEERWANAERADFDADPNLRFIDPLYRRGLWVEQVHPLHAARREDEADLRAAFPKRLEFVRTLVRAGASVIAGTDTPNPYVVPGFSLHEELRLLVRAGETPAQALLSATSLAAKALRVDDRLGTVEEGKLADFLVLSADPLRDISNLKRIEWTVVGGRPFERAELDSSLERVARGFERTAPGMPR